MISNAQMFDMCLFCLVCTFLLLCWNVAALNKRARTRNLYGRKTLRQTAMFDLNMSISNAELREHLKDKASAQLGPLVTGAVAYSRPKLDERWKRQRCLAGARRHGGAWKIELS